MADVTQAAFPATQIPISPSSLPGARHHIPSSSMPSMRSIPNVLQRNIAALSNGARGHLSPARRTEIIPRPKPRPTAGMIDLTQDVSYPSYVQPTTPNKPMRAEPMFKTVKSPKGMHQTEESLQENLSKQSDVPARNEEQRESSSTVSNESPITIPQAPEMNNQEAEQDAAGPCRQQ